MKTNMLFAGIIILMMSGLHAQTLGDLVKEGETLFQKTQSMLAFPKSSQWNPLQDFYTNLDTIKNVNLLETQLREFQSQQYIQDVGLVFKANAQYNFRNNFDEETNNFNIGRIRAELEWNILSSGYTYNRTKSKRLENEIKMLQNNRIRDERILMRRQFRIDYTYNINQETINLFENFIRFENKYFDFLNKLYYKKHIKRERIIEVSQQISVLKNQIQVLKKQNNIIKDSVSQQYLTKRELPYLKLQIDSLYYLNSTKNLYLQKENVRLQHKPINDLNFSLYVQESFNYSRNGHRFVPSVGIRFRAPIRFNQRKKIVETKLKILTAQHIDKSVGKQNRIITLIAGYNEKLKDVQNQFKNWKVVEERIRILSVLKSELNHQETGTLVLELQEEQFKILENILQLKRQLYTTIAHIFEVTEFPKITMIVEPIDFRSSLQTLEISLKHSDVFNLELQIEFLKAKNYNHIEVLEKDIAIQEALKKANIKFNKVKTTTLPELENAILLELNQIQIKS
ncbi:hypothetical protein AAON49_12565 [Pseudotenacibaculum sp. MALMAid0570]|uniref:hypothetical protein n=1 Tax=Pseudotenacibaculum sp. MALMAid0570 TaxID=3143938 RepID=UPI0032E0175F